jgi:hypothetical protein
MDSINSNIKPAVFDVNAVSWVQVSRNASINPAAPIQASIQSEYGSVAVGPHAQLVVNSTFFLRGHPFDSVLSHDPGVRYSFYFHAEFN